MLLYIITKVLFLLASIDVKHSKAFKFLISFITGSVIYFLLCYIALPHAQLFMQNMEKDVLEKYLFFINLFDD